MGRSRYRRRSIALSAVTLLVCAGGGWVLFEALYDPRVPPAPPVVLHRPRSGDEITLVFGGDFAPTDAAMPRIRERGWRYPYEATAALLREADVSLVNLEAPVTRSDDRFPLYKKYIYKVEPAALAAWQWLGLDAVALANNHVGDYRDGGLDDTLWYLDGAGIAHAGAGMDETAARRPLIFDVAGTRIGYLAYLEDHPGYRMYLRSFARGGTAGCARLTRADVAEDVRRLRPRVDVLVVGVHWGENYRDVTPNQERTGRWLAGLGVDLVAGHHAHDVQPLEVWGDTLILYSLGNYAWGTPGWPHLRVGFLARVRVTPRWGAAAGRIRAVELLPLATQNSIVDFQPRPIRPDERSWLDPFLAGSRARGAEVELEGTTIRVGFPR
ncbi:MAG: CapA family protein [Deltaproteobacteria bacterium]|nr:CapA family protein [Deltaproteobacteria bacterium]